jgi:GTP cyclohydrolase I
MSENNKDIDKLFRGLFDFPNGNLVVERMVSSSARIRGALADLFSGYGKTAEGVLNETVRVKNYSGLIIVRDIHFYTFCEHHFLPFFGVADVIYEPRQIITGLGKIVRLVRDVHARRLQIQETMTKEIAEDLMKVLNAKGAFVRTRARHLCICSRGPSDDSAWTEVAYRLGTLSSRTIIEFFGASDQLSGYGPDHVDSPIGSSNRGGRNKKRAPR